MLTLILTEQKTKLTRRVNDFSIHYSSTIVLCYGIWTVAYSRTRKKDLRDPIDEHAKMHELGIAHGHGGNKESYEMSGKLEHKHDEV